MKTSVYRDVEIHVNEIKTEERTKLSKKSADQNKVVVWKSRKIKTLTLTLDLKKKQVIMYNHEYFHDYNNFTLDLQYTDPEYS